VTCDLVTSLAWINVLLVIVYSNRTLYMLDFLHDVGVFSRPY